MESKKIKKLSLFLGVCVASTIFWEPVDVYAEAMVDEVQTGLMDYTELYGLEKNKDIMPLGKKYRDISSFRRVSNANESSDIKYIAILVEFPDENMKDIHLDDANTLKAAEMIAKTGGKILLTTGESDIISIEEYFNKYSYGKLNVDVEYFPKENGEVISYESEKPRAYYMRKSDSNPIGYAPEERIKREAELFNEVANAVKDDIEEVYEPTDIDSNGDNVVDAVNFFVEGEFLDRNVTRGDVLWSHKIDLLLNTKIHGKSIARYNVNNAGDSYSPAGIFSHNGEKNATTASENLKLNRASYSVIMHEFFHTLGIYDLYRVGRGYPVGFYDIMANNIPTNPQPVLTVNSRENLQWGSEIPTFKVGETVEIHRPQYINASEKTSYKIESELNNEEYFIVEYYDKPDGVYQSGRGDGLIIYRVRKNAYNNLEGSIANPEKDYVYIFRPNEKSLGEANEFNLRDAVILPQIGTTYGKTLDETTETWDKDSIYFSNGKNSGIKIEIVETTDNSISVRYVAPSTNGSGTEQDPYLISSVQEWKNFVNSGKHVKLTKDIDFAGEVLEEKALSNAVIDGDGKILSNIKVKGSGLFESISNTNIKNLTIDNITVEGNEGGHAGGLVGAIYDGTIDNVHILNGTVKGGTANEVTIQGVGGFVGTISGGNITNSSAKVNVSNGKNIGGFIGLAQGGTVNNNTASGIVEFSQGEKAGAFYGSNLNFGAILDATYNNNLYEVTNDQLKVASSNGNKEGIYGVEVANNLNVDLSKNKEVKYEIKTYGTTAVEASVQEEKIENSDIATVSNKTITGVKEGKTNLLLKLQIANTILNLQRPVEVINTVDTKPLEAIALDKNNLVLNVSENGELHIKYTPVDTTDDKTITWKSDNEGIATVSNGIVTAISPGKTIITATVKDKVATAEVIVNLPSTGIELNIGDFELNKGESKEVVAKLLPEGTTDNAELTWTSSDNSVATVENGVINAIEKGISIIKVTAKVGDKIYEKSIVVSVKENDIQPPVIMQIGTVQVVEKVGLGTEIGVQAEDNISENLTISVENLPAGLIYDAGRRVITGTPTLGDWAENEKSREFTVTIKARDEVGNEGIQNFSIIILRDTDNDGVPDIEEKEDGETSVEVDKSALFTAIRELENELNIKAITEGKTAESVAAYETAVIEAQNARDLANIIIENKQATIEEVTQEIGKVKYSKEVLINSRNNLKDIETPIIEYKEALKEAISSLELEINKGVDLNQKTPESIKLYEEVLAEINNIKLLADNILNNNEVTQERVIEEIKNIEIARNKLLEAKNSLKEIEVPEPEVEDPEIKEPEIKEPEVVEPEIKEPEVIEPEIKEPEIKEPEEGKATENEEINEENKEKEEVKEIVKNETDNSQEKIASKEEATKENNNKVSESKDLDKNKKASNESLIKTSDKTNYTSILSVAVVSGLALLAIALKQRKK